LHLAAGVRPVAMRGNAAWRVHDVMMPEVGSAGDVATRSA